MDQRLLVAFVLLTLASIASIAVFPTAMAQFAYVVPILFLFIAIGAFLLLLLHYAYTLLEVRSDLAVGALGLPEGSVRAFLTIGLLVLVAVFGTFIYFESGKSGTYTVVRADVPVTSAEDLAALIKSVEGKFVVIPKGESADVVSSTPDTTKADVAKQLLTMIATALTTVIGFYFGTSAATASTVAAGGTGGNPAGPITFSPTSGGPGDPVRITGSGFGTDKGRVLFGDIAADLTDAAWAPSEVRVKVPGEVRAGKVKVTVVPAGASRSLVSDVDFEVTKGAGPASAGDPQDAVDGCNVPITTATADKDLPAADGGVAQ